MTAAFAHVLPLLGLSYLAALAVCLRRMNAGRAFTARLSCAGFAGRSRITLRLSYLPQEPFHHVIEAAK